MKNAVDGKPWDVYTRVSTEDQAKGLSCELQREASVALLRIHDHRVGEVITDDGCSAKDLKRPGATKLLAKIDAGELGGVIVYKLDRLTRSVRDLFLLLERLEKSNTALVSVRENIDTTSAMGRFFVGLIGLIAQWEREQTVERVQAGMDHIRAKGGFMGGRVPVGCKVEGGKKDRRLVKDPVWGDIVQDAWARILKGSSLGQVRDWLNQVDLPARKGSWSTTGVHKLLLNERYIGLLVGRDTYDLVKSTMNGRQAPGKVGGDTLPIQVHSERIWPISGILKCPSCSAPMVGVTVRNARSQPFHYMRCSVRNRKGRSQCAQKDLPAETVEHMVLEALVDAVKRQAKDLVPAFEQLIAKAEQQAGPMSQQRKELHLDRDRIRIEMNNLGLVAAAGGAAARAISAPLAERQLEIEALESQIGVLDAQLSSCAMIGLDATVLADVLVNDVDELVDEEPEEQARALRALLGEVKIRKITEKKWEVDLSIRLPRVPALFVQQCPMVEVATRRANNDGISLRVVVERDLLSLSAWRRLAS